MAESLYEQCPSKELTLRDRLALDRTRLANERTLLAYLRSALSLLIVGVTIIHFLETGLLLYVGFAAIPSGLVMAVLGIKRYRTMVKSIEAARESSRCPTEP